MPEAIPVDAVFLCIEDGEACALPEAKIASSIALVGEPVSLDAPRGEAAKNLLEDLNATEPNAYAVLLGQEQSEVIERLLRRLSERERQGAA